MNEIITKDNKQIISFLSALDSMLDAIEALVAGYKAPLNGETYLTDKEVSERLKISRRTLQEWRNNGRIEYIQFDGKILYSESAIQRLLEKHHQKAWCE